MKIFDQVKPWPDKVNFVDANNIVVGYDMSQQCCEYASWYISDSTKTDFDKSKDAPDDVEEYLFDPEYMVMSEFEDHGWAVRFRLVADNKPGLYLHLYNVHNGYYSHGFTVEQGGVVVKDGNI
jgi:hypothetical protein